MAGILSQGTGMTGGVLSRQPQSLFDRLGFDVSSPQNQVALAFANNIIGSPDSSPFAGVAAAANQGQQMQARKVELSQIVKKRQQEDQQSAQLKQMLAGDPMATQFLLAGQPEQAMKIYEHNKGLDATPEDPYTLGPGQTRFGPGGSVLASVPAADAAAKAPNGYTWAPGSTPDAPKQTFIPGGPADPSTAGKTTEATRRNQQLAKVIVPEMTSLLGPNGQGGTFDALSNGWSQGLDMLGPVGLAVGGGPSADYQQAKNSLKTIIASYLYSVSGATANPGEVETQASVLTPKPGEAPASVAEKKRRIATMVQAVVDAAKGTSAAFDDPAASGPSAGGTLTYNPQTGELE